MSSNTQSTERTAGEIFTAIPRVMADVDAIKRDTKNVQQGFMTRNIDAFYNALQPVLAKHGVFIVPEVLETQRKERTSKQGSILFHVEHKIRFTFFAKDGSSVVVIAVGEAADSGDKANNKAMTGAYKQALEKVFCLATEKSSDPDYESHEFNGEKSSGYESRESDERFPFETEHIQGKNQPLIAGPNPTKTGHITSMWAQWKAAGKSEAELKALIETRFGKHRTQDLTVEETLVLSGIARLSQISKAETPKKLVEEVSARLPKT